MSKQRRNMVSFSAIAVAGFVAYLWVVSDALGPQVVHANDLSTATMGAPATLTPVAEPALWELFGSEKRAAPSAELPSQF
jgi:hypothetical protein